MFNHEPVIKFTETFMKTKSMNIIVLDRMMDAPAKCLQLNRTNELVVS